MIITSGVVSRLSSQLPSWCANLWAYRGHTWLEHMTLTHELLEKHERGTWDRTILQIR